MRIDRIIGYEYNGGPLPQICIQVKLNKDWIAIVQVQYII